MSMYVDLLNTASQQKSDSVSQLTLCGNYFKASGPQMFQGFKCLSLSRQSCASLLSVSYNDDILEE